MKKLFLIPVAAMLFAACSNETENTDNDGPVPLQVSASNISVTTEVTTRAANLSWGSGDQIGIIGVPTGYTPVAASNTTVVNGNTGKYSTTVTTATTYAAPAAFTDVIPVYLPANGTAIDVYGYYPWVDGTIEPTIVTANVKANQSDPSDYYASDFMRAFNNKTAINTSTGELLGEGTAITRANATTVLNFKHKLTKLVFNISKGTSMTDADIAAISSVTISNQPTTATYNIYENGVASATNPLKITDNSPEPITACNTVAASSGTATYEVIVYPNKNGEVAIDNNNAGNRTVTITTGGQAYSFTIDSGTAFESGKQYTYTVTMQAAKLVVSAAITDWTPIAGGDKIAQ